MFSLSEPDIQIHPTPHSLENVMRLNNMIRKFYFKDVHNLCRHLEQHRFLSILEHKTPISRKSERFRVM